MDIKIIEKNEGEKIPFEVTGTKIIFNDEVMINLKSRARDYEVTLDICKDVDGGLTVGLNESAREYVAQIIIPAKEYQEIETDNEENSLNEAEGTTVRKNNVRRIEKKFDISKCTLILWALI